jgi:hypothetical protein
MKLITRKSFTNLEIIDLLNRKGVNATEKSFLFGGKQIKAEQNGLSFTIKNKGNELIVELIVPIWVRIIAIISTMIIASIILSAIAGDAVIVQGGFIVILIGFLIGDGIYKSSKSDLFKNICSDLTETINK